MSSSSEQRRRWISAISRDDLTEGKRENDRVCSKHFVSGEPAKEWDRFNVDWDPTQNLGHHKLRGDPEKVAERANRAAQRRKRKKEVLEKEISEKRKRISEPGKPVEEIFQGVAEAPVTRLIALRTPVFTRSRQARIRRNSVRLQLQNLRQVVPSGSNAWVASRLSTV